MNVDPHELRSALGRFLEAKRALQEAYRRSVASHRAEMIPMVERVTSVQDGKDYAMSEELQELKDENERLRKSLALLHAHSLKLQDQLDTQLGHKNMLLGACEVVASRVPEDPRADEYPGALAGQFDGAPCELTDEPKPNGWTTKSASAGIAG